jgi:hypothetical protein
MMNPNLAPPGPLRSNTVNAVNVPTGPNGPTPYRPPVAGVHPTLPPGQPARLGNQQFRPVQQNVQLAPRAKGPPPEKCPPRGCRR